jgi:hypothetical protein
VRVEFNWELEDPSFAVVIQTDKGVNVFATSSTWAGCETGSFRGGEVATISVAFENFLAPGRYYVSPQVVLLTGPGAGVVDSRERAAAMVVTGTGGEGSLTNLPHDLTVERARVGELSA